MQEQSDLESKHPLALASFVTALGPLVMRLAHRQYLLSQTCPLHPQSESDNEKTLRLLVECNRVIDVGLNRLRQTEAAVDGEIGVTAMIGKKAANCDPLYCAAALLIASRINGAALAFETKRIADLISWSAGSQGIAALIVRDSLRFGGVLYPHVSITNPDFMPLDCVSAELLDESLAQACGRPADRHEMAAAVYARNQPVAVQPRRRRPF